MWSQILPVLPFLRASLQASCLPVPTDLLENRWNFAPKIQVATNSIGHCYTKIILFCCTQITQQLPWQAIVYLLVHRFLTTRWKVLKAKIKGSFVKNKSKKPQNKMRRKEKKKKKNHSLSVTAFKLMFLLHQVHLFVLDILWSVQSYRPTK